jgi:hypothetical protein
MYGTLIRPSHRNRDLATIASGGSGDLRHDYYRSFQQRYDLQRSDYEAVHADELGVEHAIYSSKGDIVQLHVSYHRIDHQ